MKLAFIFPPYRTKEINSLSGPPLSTPSLIGNIKDHFLDIKFEQIDLNNEIEKAINDDDISNDDFLEYKNEIDNLIKGPKRMTDNRFKANYYIPTNKDLDKFEIFLEKIYKHVRLDKFDHYFLSVYQIYEPDIIAIFLLARFLKKRNKNKKIIFGGMRSFNHHLAEKIKELNFIDALVINYGENSVKEIINYLKNKKRLKKIYKIFVPDKETISLPDYKSFRNIDNFRFDTSDINRRYKIKLKEKKLINNIFLPYRFSVGCFWNKCSYCSNSRHKRFVFNTKKVEEIISDILKLKKDFKTRYFIFYNNNFNSNLEFSKKLLRSFIKNKLNILWTDSFNLKILDDELIDLLVRAGCIRMDIGLTTFNQKLQKFYNNIIQNDQYLENLKKIHQKGVWVDINMIANLPYSYSVDLEIEYLKKYHQYIDSVTLNSYRLYNSELFLSFNEYNLNKIDERVIIDNKIAPMYFIENSFNGSLSERKKIFVKNYLDLKNFFLINNIILNSKYYYLLASLYDYFGFKNKNKIKEIVLSIDSKEYKNY